MTLLNFDDAPTDPLVRLWWMTGIKEQVQNEIDTECEHLYARLRLEGRFEAAVEVGLHTKKRALALTRRANRTRSIRWNDGLDVTSSAYRKAGT